MNKKYIDEQSKEKLVHYSSGINALKDLTDLGNADENTSQDYAGRFAFELMQNGADAYQKASQRDPDRYPSGKGKVYFALTESCLIVANTGAPFSHIPDKEDRQDVSSIESISRLGESTKKSGEYIGNKGIGFRSIYQICDRLILISGGYQICYHGKKTYHAIRERLQNGSNNGGITEKCRKYLENYENKIPMLKVGFWFDIEKLPETVSNIVHEMQDEGYDTIMILERTGENSSDRVDMNFIWDRLATLSEKEILFLDTLCEVRCRNAIEPEKSFSFQLDRRDDFRVVRKSPENNQWEFLVFRFPIPELAATSQMAQIAFQLDENRCPCPAKPSDRVFYTFYPAVREKHGFPFFIHSYFMLSPNREYFNSESMKNIKRNKILLEDLAGNIVNDVIPELKRRYPDVFLPKILMPKLTNDIRDRLNDLENKPQPSLEILSRQGAVSAYFIREVLQKMSAEGLVKDLKNNYLPIRNLKRTSPGDQLSAQVADCLFSTLHQQELSEYFPEGLITKNEELNTALRDIEHFFKGEFLSLNDLAVAFDNLESNFILSPKDAGSLIVLLSKLSGGDSYSLRKTLERIRETRLRLLPCRGEENNQPFPQFPEKGVLLRASSDAPLVFYSPSRAEIDEDDIESDEATNIADKLDLPSFCHVHVLKDEVLSAIPQVNEDQMRTVLKEQLGLRPFKPEDIFTRISESTISSAEVDNLTNSQHREFLETTIRLIEKRRLRGSVQSRKYEFRPWILKEQSDSDRRLYYYLSRAFIPVAEDWLPGSSIILAGVLSQNGEKIRSAYQETDQIFLDESNEATWFVELLDSYFDKYVDQSDLNDEDIETEHVNFRRLVYQYLGAWDGLRIDIIHHPGGRYSKADTATKCPHDFIDNIQWKEHCAESKRSTPWSSYSLAQCSLLQSAAVPYFEELTRDESRRNAVIEGMQTALSILKKCTQAVILSPKNSRGEILSFLSYQLKRFPWVDPKLRDPGISDNSTPWFTRQDIPPNTHSRQSAHYLLSVTAKQINEPLARVAGMPVLEDASLEQLADFIELHYQLCQRVEREPSPGSGFYTLYQYVISRIQQILLGKNPEKTKLAEIKIAREKELSQIRSAGIVVMTGETGLELWKELSGVYYDDTGSQNPIFRKFLPMAAFDDTSRSFARLLDINLLSDAYIKYDDGKDDTFAGHEDIEEDIERKLDELCAPLFAFRAFAIFIPEAQRLKVGEGTYKRRWDMFKNLKVEVVPMLRISIGDQPPKEIPPDFPIILEHESSNQQRRRLFIRESTLSDEGEVPLRILARPLAAALGAEAQTIAVEMLLTQYSDGLDSVYTYLEEQCGVSRDQIKDLEKIDEDMSKDREREIQKIEIRILKAIEQHCPECVMDEDRMSQLREILTHEQSLEALPILAFLQNQLGIPLHLISDALSLKPFHMNINNYKKNKAIYKPKLLMMTAKHFDINEPGCEWEELLESYDLLTLPKDLQFRIHPVAEQLFKPINSWLEKQCKFTSLIGINPELTEAEQDLWEKLNPGLQHGTSDIETNRALLNVVIPWIIALCKRTAALPIPDLLDALDEYGLQELIEDGESLTEIKERLEDFLGRYHVSRESVKRLISGWPSITPENTGLKIEFVERIRIEIERYRSRQKSRSQKLVKKYVQYITGLISENKVKTTPLSMKLDQSTEGEKQATLSDLPSISPKKYESKPKKQKRNTVSESDFIAANFRNKVVGECGENFVLEIQRLRWKKLAEENPQLAIEFLEHLKEYYDFGNSKEDAEHLAKWDFLKEIDPSLWTDDRNWRVLKSLIYMADWSVSAGFDIIGLFENEELGNCRLMRVEVKATRGKTKLDFPISRNELKTAEHDGDTYVIWRVLNVVRGRIPSYLLLQDPVKLIKEGKISTADQITILKPNVVRINV